MKKESERLLNVMLALDVLPEYHLDVRKRVEEIIEIETSE